MALSGSFYTNVNSHWRVRCTWSGTQSITGNYTDVTLKTYWESTDSYGTTYTTATKNGTSTIYDYNSSGSDDTDSFTFSAKLDGQDSVLVHTQTVRVYHNSDGKKTFSMSASLSIELTLSGTYYGTVTASSGTVTLDTIPRKSTLTSSASWTAGNNLAVSISRADSSFTHTVEVYVKNSSGSYVKVATRTGIGTSTTVTFSTSENTSIFQTLNQSGSAGSMVRLYTYSGSTSIGYNDYTGTCTNASASTISLPDFNIGDSPTATITRTNSAFTHNVYVVFGSFTSSTKTGVGTSALMDNLTASSMYAQIPNSNSGTGTIYCTTYYNGVQVRAATSDTFTAKVTNSNPVFTSSQFTYEDVNSTTLGITGDKTYIVQNQSKLRVTVTSSATMKNSATFNRYVVTVNGQEKTLSQTTGYVEFDKIAASSDQTVTVTVYDSRGNSTPATQTVKVLAYSEPTLSISLTRRNKFESATTLKVSGSFSGLNSKNTIQTLVYRYKQKSDTSFGSDQTMSFTISGTTFSAIDVNLTLDNTKAWDFEIAVTDRLLTNTDPASVGTGQPIMFIDTVKKSVGIGIFPTNSDSFETIGSARFGGQTYITRKSGGQSLSLIQADFTSGGGAYNYIGFCDETGAWKSYIGHSSARDGHFTMHTTLGDVKLSAPAGNQIYATRKLYVAEAGSRFQADGQYSSTDPSGGAIRIEGYNNLLYMGTGNTNNDRNAWIQSRHLDPNYSTAMGTLSLQPLGGDLKIGSNQVVIDPKKTINTGLEIGSTSNTSAVYSFIDFHSGTTATDYDGRIICYGGSSTTGQGIMTYYGSAHNFENGYVNGLLKHESNYFVVGAYSSSYGTGYARVWYDSNGNSMNFWNQNNGKITLVASSFSTTSKREYKTNIVLDQSSALDKIKATPVYDYHMKEDLEIWAEDENGEWKFTGQYRDPTTVKKRKGLILEEAPEELNVNDEAIDLYAMTAMLWKAVQELSDKIEQRTNFLDEKKLDKPTTA
ncbi:DUF859 family phage minor structural protein [Neobacillus vireti]|uniref:DUF859 family phage minor structural protein n=1 Tax=Neobacillus vireti TaxID=220686 RepID=UPI00300035F4